MRFGHGYQQRIIPEWAQYYVDYNLLKHYTKSPDLSGLKVYCHLETSIRALESFIALRLDSLNTAETEICGLFGLEVQPRTLPDAAQICPFELTLLLETFYEFQQDLQNLQWFERVNTEAVDRIRDKLARRGQAGSPSYRNIQAEWQNSRTAWNEQLHGRLNRLNTLIADIMGGLIPPRQDTGKSLYLTRAFHCVSWPRTVTDPIIKALQAGNSSFVVEALASSDINPGVCERDLQTLACDLLRYSVMLMPALANALLTILPVPEEFLIEHDVIKWSILAQGRKLNFDLCRKKRPDQQYHASVGLQPLPDILKACTRQLSEMVVAKDKLGRSPLHYAAMYRLPEVCKWLLEAVPPRADMTRPNQSTVLKALLTADNEGLTPLHMAVISDHTETVCTLEEVAWDRDGRSRSPRAGDVLGDLLSLALRNENDYIFRAMISRDTIATSLQAALVLAVQFGHTKYVSALLSGSSSEKTHFDMPDGRGWTPLFHACALGHYEVVKLLLAEGASQASTDDLGWTAKEYAVLKGHLAVGDLFEASPSLDMECGPASAPGKNNTHARLHCGRDERIIVATLGTERVDSVVTEVNISYCSSVPTPGSYKGLSYVLEVSAPGSRSPRRTVRLPILDDQINDPFVFAIPATEVEPQLMFKIIRSGFSADGQDILSLIREETVPILDKESMALAGTVTFTFMIVDPFPHLETSQQVDLVRHGADPPHLVGHRGLGQNLKTHEYLQIGENTVQSFLSAAKLGASFVEFDVQVTRDREAVIFHDFSLSESGTDVPVHDLTLDQFLHASNTQSPHGNPLSILGPIHYRDEPDRKRSRSVGRQFEAGAIQVRDRMKHTVDFKLKGFKPNTRGDFIQDSFATLKDLLAAVPEDIGFDMEIKYPRLHEAVDAGVAPVAIELNAFVDVALDAIHQQGGGGGSSRRQIMLSSFTPEICILLSAKQRAYPVLFITNAGKLPMSDMERRAASVQVAVRFAQRWGLAGVVFACEALLLCPRLVGYVKSRGLVCATYGTLNNVPENVKMQAEAGVDIVIADRVGLVAKSLGASPALK